MVTTIDKAGRIVVPAEMRKRLKLEAGVEVVITVEGSELRIVRNVPTVQLRRRGTRLVAQPRAKKSQRSDVDIAALVEEERSRWPG